MGDVGFMGDVGLLFAEAAAFALTELATETLIDEVAQAVAEGFEGDAVEYFTDESKLQQHASFLFGNTTLTHVEEGFVVELTHGAAVGALYVIGIDFQHGLGVHTCGVSGHKVGIGLL